MRFPLVLTTFVVVYAHRKVSLSPGGGRVRDDNHEGTEEGELSEELMRFLLS